QDGGTDEHDRVAEQRRRAIGGAAGEEHQDAGVREQDAGEAPHAEAIAGDQEVREHDGVDGVQVQDDGAVRGVGERRRDVHGANLRGEERAEHEERLPLVALDAEAGQASGRPRPQRDDAAADEEAQPGQPERRRVEQADLDGDDVAAPEQTDQQRQRRAGRVEVAGALGQGSESVSARTAPVERSTALTAWWLVSATHSQPSPTPTPPGSKKTSSRPVPASVVTRRVTGSSTFTLWL